MTTIGSNPLTFNKTYESFRTAVLKVAGQLDDEFAEMLRHEGPIEEAESGKKEAGSGKISFPIDDSVKKIDEEIVKNMLGRLVVDYLKTHSNVTSELITIYQFNDKLNKIVATVAKEVFAEIGKHTPQFFSEAEDSLACFERYLLPLESKDYYTKQVASKS